MSELLVVVVTFPNEESVRQIGTLLVEKQLIACINCLPSLTSIYQWQGKVCEEQECLGIMKTTRDVYPLLEKEIKLLHPYDVPEIIALNVEQAEQAYSSWVKSNVLTIS